MTQPSLLPNTIIYLLVSFEAQQATSAIAEFRAAAEHHIKMNCIRQDIQRFAANRPQSRINMDQERRMVDEIDDEQNISEMPDSNTEMINLAIRRLHPWPGLLFQRTQYFVPVPVYHIQHRSSLIGLCGA